MVALGLAAYLALGCSHPPIKKEYQKSPNTEHADYVIAEYLQERCVPCKEHFVVFLDSEDRLADLTKASDAYRAGFHEELFGELAKNEGLMVGAHCHCLSLEDYIEHIRKYRDEKELDLVSGHNRDVVEKRLLQELPSAPSDVWGTLSRQLFYRGNNPLGKFEERIVVTNPGKPPRVIGFGLQEDKQRLFNSFADEYSYVFDEMKEYLSAKDNSKKDSAKENELLERFRKAGERLSKANQSFLKSYTDARKKYDKSRCRPETTGECIEPSFEEFAKIINDEGVWFLEDHGYVDLKGK
jgi:hypothetical protein